MKKKSIAIIICLFMLLGVILPATPGAYAEPNLISIQHEGITIEEIIVPTNERETLTAVANNFSVDGWQWQLLIDAQSDQWVDIYGKTDAECEFSYAMVKNLLDDSNSVYIRCGAVSGETEFYSDSVCITMVEPKSNNSDVSTEEMVLIEEGTPSPEIAIDKKDKTLSTVKSYSLSIASEETTNYKTITIEYLDWTSWNKDGIEAPIYSSYVAVLQEGAEFKKDVISPSFLGFAPKYDADGDGTVEETEDATIISFDIDEVTEDITYKVYYMPVEVNYAIRYMYQNIHDDMYTENANFYATGTALTGTVITDEIITKKLKEKDTTNISGTGFQKLYHYPEAVSADGSTVFECYYDRNYYLVQFDMQGGYGVEPIFARYGTPFLVNDPVKAGYSFAGWKLTKIDKNNDGVWEDVPAGMSTDLVNEIPAYDCYYEAQWTADNTATATVVYWLQNAEPNADGTYGYTYWQIEELTGLISGDTISAEHYSDISNCSWYKFSEHQYYEYNEALTKSQATATVKGDGSTTVNVYYDRKEYTLQFIFARSNGTQYQNANLTGTDDYTSVSWGKRTLNQSNWNTVTGSSNPKCKSFVNDGWTYYYFEITDKYGARIDDEWVNINNLLANNPIVTDNVFVSWRTNDDSGYAKSNTSNKNLKGAYPYMDDMVIMKDSSGTVLDEPHIMTAYNNTGVSYYQYEIYFKDTVSGNYNLQNSFIVNPTAAYNQQTSFSFTGMKLVKTEYYDRDDEGNLVVEKYPNTTPDKANNSVEKPAIIKFYYDPLEYSLSFYNYNGLVDSMTNTVAYGSSLSSYKPAVDPDYPNVLEEDAYVFSGWYTTAGCYAGTEVNWNSDSMPAHNAVVYAKWTPVVHTVNFFNNYNDMLAYEDDPSTTTVAKHASFTDIEHGNVIGQPVDNPTTADTISGMPLTFAGWFYMENGEKKAFTPLDMPINRDMNIFADWSSQSPQPYRIQYVKYNDDPSAEKVKVADDTFGYAYGGTTRTFSAKAGNPFNQLYMTYNNGWFPTVGSHSITIAAEENDKNPVLNTFSFEYVNVPEVSYKVRYLDTSTGLPVAPEKTVITGNAVVTERFAIVTDMVPDAFFKNLTLSVEKNDDGEWVSSASNVITFYYTANKQNAYYAVHHMMETVESAKSGNNPTCTINSSDFVEFSRTEGTGKLNEQINITPLSTSGFSVIGNAGLIYEGKTADYTPTPTSTSLTDGKYKITVTAAGTELYIFYERNSYPYKVNYYLFNTTTPVPGVEDVSPEPTTEGSAVYGDTVTITAPTIGGYTCVSNNPQNMTIREEKSGNITQNILTFYYSPTQYTVEYKAVTDDGGDTTGLLSNTIEVKTGSAEFDGSVPDMDNPYYEFNGWYQDEACTIPANTDGKATIQAGTNRLIPEKSKLSDTASNIFYAKFTLASGDLTIKRSSTTDTNRVYVYKVENIKTKEIIYVTTTSTQGQATITDLPYGEYDVTQQNDWSWRNTDEAQRVEHNNESGSSDTEVNFNKAVSKDSWLNGNSPLVKNKRGD